MGRKGVERERDADADEEDGRLEVEMHRIAGRRGWRIEVEARGLAEVAARARVRDAVDAIMVINLCFVERMRPVVVSCECDPRQG